MPQDHPYFIATAYLLTAAVTLGMIAAILLDRRNLQEALAKIGKARPPGERTGE